MLTTLECAILGLLAAKPMSGYDLHRLFVQTPMAYFSASPGAIYPALKRLVRRGLVTAKLDTTREARPRRVHSLTPTGSATLDSWLREPVSREEIVRGPSIALLRFSVSQGRLSPEEVIESLQQFRLVIELYLGELEAHLVAINPEHLLYGALALEHGVESYRCTLGWLDHTLARLQLDDDVTTP